MMIDIAMTRLERNGSAAVEFAILAPVFVLLILFISVESVRVLAQSVLDNATFSAARTVLTNKASRGQQSFQATLCAALSAIAPCNQVQFAVIPVAASAGFATIVVPTLDGSGNLAAPSANPAYAFQGAGGALVEVPDATSAYGAPPPAPANDVLIQTVLPWDPLPFLDAMVPGIGAPLQSTYAVQTERN